MNIPDKQKLIISTGTELFYSLGIKKVSVEKICTEAKISKKTFYKYYSNKNSLVIEILEELKDKEKNVFDSIKNEDIPFGEKIIKITNSKMEIYSGAEMIFFRDAIENCSDISSIMEKWKIEGERIFFEFVSKEQHLGKIRSDVPASFISYILVHQVNEAIFNTEVEKMMPELKKRVKLIVDCYMNGFGK